MLQKINTNQSYKSGKGISISCSGRKITWSRLYAINPTKAIFTGENDNNQVGNTKKSDLEILKNAKPKEIVKFVNTETHQESTNRVKSTE